VERGAKARIDQNSSKEDAMAKEQERARNKGLSASPHTKGDAPQHRGGDAARKAQRWGGGNKASKGPPGTELKPARQPIIPGNVVGPAQISFLVKIDNHQSVVACYGVSQS
jgi:hypothetical protein